MSARVRQPDDGPDRRGERGFTLIELLVVITILAILAAVVIFAVGGVGGDSEEKAKQADARVLRTAEETYCARNGTYAEYEDLIPKFLARPTRKLNDVAPGDLGHCGASGEGKVTSFEIFDPTDTPVAAGSIPVGANPRGIAVNSNTHRVYVANHGSGSVSVIDGTRGTVVKTVPGIPGAETVALNPAAASNKVYVVTNDDAGVNNAYVIDGAAPYSVLAGPFSVPGGSGSYAPVAVDTDSGTAYVCRTGSDKMLAIDASNAARTISLPGSGTCGSNIAVNPGNGKVYTLGQTGLVILPPGGTGKVVSFSATEEYWSPSVAVDPRSGNAYAVGGSANPGTIMVVNSSDDMIETHTDPPLPAPTLLRNTVVVNPDSGAVFVAGVSGSGTPIVSRFAGTEYDGQVNIAPTLAGACPNPNPASMAIHPGFNRIFVTCAEGAPPIRAGLAIVDGTRMTSDLVTLPMKGAVGTRNAYAVAVDTKDNSVYVTNDFAPGYVHVLR